MKLAVMQPYFFPYVGYFQLIDAVDVFVSYDDVAYIKKGWINRNFLLMGCAPARFTVPVQDASQFRPICDTAVSSVPWKEKFLKTLRHAYAHAPHFASTYALAESVVSRDLRSIAELALASLCAVSDYLGLTTVVRPTSRAYGNAELKGPERILDICRREGATVYVNPPGGRPLYEPREFAERGIELRFLEPGAVRYAQFQCAFVPNLSMLDVLMFNDRDAVRDLLRMRRLDP